MGGIGSGLTALLWQTAVILLGAYFVGCWMGCLCRRVFFAGRVAEPAPAPVLVVPAAEPAVARFEAALSGSGVPPLAAEPAPPPAPTRVEPAPAPAPRPQANIGTAAALAAAAAAASMPRSQMPSSPGDPFPAAAGSSGQTSVAAPYAPLSVPAGPAQDLTDIRGIDAPLAARLAGLGVTRFEQIASWLPADVARVAKELGLKGVISRDNWIEQAQILAKGGATSFSMRKAQASVRLAAPGADEGQRLDVAALAAAAAPRPAPQAPPAIAPLPPAASEPPATANDAAAAAARIAAAAAAVAEVAKEVPRAAAGLTPVTLSPAIGLARDNLKRIGGINGEVERLLNVQGVTKYAQIANWSDGDVSRFDRLLGFEGRIARENWIEQAQILARGGETAYSKEVDRRAADAVRPAKLADAIKAQSDGPRAPRSDVAGLRSVRSEAFRGEAAAPGRPGAPDDLKRIRGIGVLIEKRLVAMGVTSYQQIANWTTQDVQRYSDKLDFKGRIERENWVEQARILASGGHTEFSKRVDRGEVESSRAAD